MASTLTGETREMRLITKVLGLADGSDYTLREFLARRRLPGDNWKSWQVIGHELFEVTGEYVSTGSLRKWAANYGIPENTTADGSPGRHGSISLTTTEYVKAIKQAKIKL